MSTDVAPIAPRKARMFPAYRRLPGLVRDPLNTLEEIGRLTSGEITRLNLGPFRPYLITRPEHVQHIMRDNIENYRREGMMWKPLSRLIGPTSEADTSWVVRRKVYWSLLSGPSLAAFADDMAMTIAEAVDEMTAGLPPDRPVDAFAEMTRIVYRTIVRVLVGDRLPLSEIDELGRVMLTATTSSFRARMLMPFVPHGIPLPGDRTFNRCVQAMDDLVFPIVRAARRQGTAGRDVVSRLLQARGGDGGELDDRQVRDGIVGLFVAGTDTTVSSLTFLWAVLDSYPDVAARLYEEIDRVIGRTRPTPAHLPGLSYTKLVLQELVRLYSVGWITPRTVAGDDVIDGVRIKKGATIAISPYLTHRLSDLWPRPHVFDPGRFAPGRSRHRFAYLAFGGGPHQCAGRQFFNVEAQLILANLLGRRRPVLHNKEPVEPRVDITLKPRQRVEISLAPVIR